MVHHYSLLIYTSNINLGPISSLIGSVCHVEYVTFESNSAIVKWAWSFDLGRLVVARVSLCVFLRRVRVRVRE